MRAHAGRGSLDGDMSVARIESRDFIEIRQYRRFE
jgi:hypothetical protein